VTGGFDTQLLVMDEQTAPGAGDTCHIDVIDRHGNAVAATPSGGWLSVRRQFLISALR
jgi:gamma-glutamyltranspeptidase